MRITVVYNARPEGLSRNDPALETHIEGDEWKTIQAVGEALSHLGHTVSYLTVDSDLPTKLSALKGKTDLLFNLAEGISGGADREAHVPTLAEMLGIPYTGPSPLSSALILNKHRAKQIWRAAGLATASSQLFTSPDLPLNPALTFPLIVKPNTDGSGIGIHATSVVHNSQQLHDTLTQVLARYHQDALVETYLPGREFTVAIVGNGDDLTVLPIIEINFAGLPSDAPAIDSYEAKFVYGATGVVPMHETELCPAPLTRTLKTKIVDLSRKAYTEIGCRDFGRLDLRLDSHNEPHLLEINHPPGLMSDPEESSFFTISARTYGWDFPTLIKHILTTALTRLKL